MRICFETRKTKLLFGFLLAILCPISCLMLGYSLKAGLVLVGITLAVTALRLDIFNRKILSAIYTGLFFAGPAISFGLGLLMQNTNAAHLDWLRICLNLLIILILQLVMFLLCSSVRVALITGQLIPFFLTLAHTYVFSFRGNSLTPTDFLSIQTAANVAAEYDFTPTAPMLYALILTAIFVLALFTLPRLYVKRNSKRMIAQCFSIILCLLCLMTGSAKVTPRYWQNYGSLYNGYLLNFLLQVKDIFIESPAGYVEDTVEELVAQYPQEGAPASSPDIIVIMDESFADFRVFNGNSGTDADIMPYIDSMRDNTIRGFLTASVFGGSTANSEYECLSGNTMGFLPNGSIVYQQYYSEDSWSLVSFLKGYGYNCVAMHPYHANGWMRDTVYPKMGFEDLYFLPDFPQEQLIREYVSDREMFEQIIRIHEAQDADTPLFLFGVTMQNHGGYAYEGADFASTVSLDGLSGDYPLAEQYLTLAQETDRAVEYLIEHYRSVERDTVIVFFGDHMPNVEPAFYEELNGGAFDTLDEQMKKQMVPFFVWANFDIEEREIPCSSINYLPLYTLEAAGLPLSPYMQFLKDTEAVIPAINAYGYYSEQKQCFLPLGEASGAEAEAIRAYEYLQYNNMFDEEHRSEHFFGNEP